MGGVELRELGGGVEQRLAGGRAGLAVELARAGRDLALHGDLGGVLCRNGS
jgi:hypothetical protein